MKKNYNFVVVIVIVAMILISILGIVLYKNKKVPLEPEFNYLKNYADNEYVPVYISNEAMAKIYFNDFLSYLKSNKTDAYYLLNKTYRDNKFPNYNDFSKYVDETNFGAPISYNIKSINNKNVFYVYSSTDQVMIFATRGVMQYEVYLDEDTVDIE